MFENDEVEILLGVVLASTASPPLIEKTKSSASRLPLATPVPLL